MAELNFNALARPGPRGFMQGFEQGQEEQRANAMTQQKMAQDREMNALRMQQVRGAIGQQEREVKTQTAAQKTGMFRERLLRARDPNAVRELVKMQYADPDLGPVVSQFAPLEQALAEVPDDPAEFQTYLQKETMGMAEWMKSQQPKMTPTGDVYDPATRSYIRKPQAAPAPAAPGAPVAVMGPDGRPQYVTREQAIGMTPFTAPAIKMMGGGAGGTRAAPAAPAPKPMTALQQQSARKAMAADQTSVKASQSVVGELEKLTDELVGNPEKKIAPHPGLSGITGFQAMLPSLPQSAVTSGNSRQAQQRLETLKGKVMAFGRQLASLEGKLGNMAVQEWKFVSDSIQAIDPAAGNLDVQLRDIVRQAKNFANTVQERYDLTYEADGAPAELTAAPSRAGGNAPAAGGLSPAEQAELDQLRKRFRK
jgi:hypothetical protein